MVVWHHYSIVNIQVKAISFLKVYQISILRNTKLFVLGVEDVWSEIFECHVLLESFVLPNCVGPHGCTRSILEWPFLQAVLVRTSDKCRVQSLLTLNAVDSESDMHLSHIMVNPKSNGIVVAVRTHYCLAVGNDEGLELDETDEDEELCESDEEQVEEDKGEDVGGIQSGGGRQENSLRDYLLKFRGLIYKYRVVCA